jgi:hypothetical protein
MAWTFEFSVERLSSFYSQHDYSNTPGTVGFLVESVQPAHYIVPAIKGIVCSVRLALPCRDVRPTC